MCVVLVAVGGRYKRAWRNELKFQLIFIIFFGIRGNPLAVRR
jgi:hypothetical protein